MARPLLVGIGEILWDMLPAGKQLGGAPGNFAYHANALGGLAVPASRVGDDALGKEILSRLDSLGLERRYIQIDPEHPTGTVDVRLSAGGVPEYVIHPNVAWDHLRLEPSLLELARQADCVCFGTLGHRSVESGQTIQAFIRESRPGCIRVFDVNLRQNYYTGELIDGLLRMSDVLKLNDQELPAMATLLQLEVESDGAIRALLRRYSLRLVVLTRGGQGSSLYDAGGAASNHPGIKTHVVDTVGAGDAFTAAVALGLLGGMPLVEINQRANRVASFVCSQSGATPAIPSSLRISGD